MDMIALTRMRHSAVLLLALIVLAGCVQPGRGPAAPTVPDAPAIDPIVPGRVLSVLANLKVNQAGVGFEPSVKVGPDGTIYVTAAEGLHQERGVDGVQSSRLWVAHNGTGFAEVEPVDAATGVSNLPYGMEGDLAVSPQGTAYFVDLTLASVTVSRSNDAGRTWLVRNAAALAVPWGDREWVAAGEGDLVAVTWISQLNFVGAITQLWVAVSTDGGLTFAQQTPVVEAPPAGASGIAIAPDGTIVVGNNGDGVNAYVSRDAGQTFVAAKVLDTTNPTDYTFVSVAADAANNLYATWAELKDGNAQVFYSASSDHGATWMAPVRVSDPGGAAASPWIAAAAAGHAAVAFYAAPGHPGDPNKVKGPWRPYLVDILDAASITPAITRLAMTDEPVSTKVICTTGYSSCGGTPPLGDFLQVAIGPDGSDHVVWATDDQDVYWGLAGVR